MKVPVSLSVLELNLQKQKKHQPYILDSENEEEFGYSFLQRSLSSARVFPQAGMRQSRLDLYIKMTYPKTLRGICRVLVFGSVRSVDVSANCFSFSCTGFS